MGTPNALAPPREFSFDVPDQRRSYGCENEEGEGEAEAEQEEACMLQNGGASFCFCLRLLASANFTVYLTKEK